MTEASPTTVEPTRFRDPVPRFDTGYLEGSPGDISLLLREASRLFGKNFLPELRKFRRALQRSALPSNPHRLIHLISVLQPFARPVAEGTPFPAWELTELRHYVKLMTLWEDHEEWPGMQSAMVSPENFGHDMALLGLASGLQGHGNSVQLLHVLAEGGSRPDLAVLGQRNEVLQLEVKSPLALRMPASDLTSEDAEKVVARAWSSASRQLSGIDSGGLCIAGNGLSDSDVVELRRAAIRRLGLSMEGETRGRSPLLRPTLYAILIMNRYSQYEPDLGALTTQTFTHFQYNPSYTGFRPKEPPVTQVPKYIGRNGAALPTSVRSGPVISVPSAFT